MEQLVIFDGDDTLWITEPLYDEARLAAGRVVAAAGFNVASWDRVQREVGVRNVAVLGLGPDRFPTSCVQALEQLAGLDHRTVTDQVRRSVWSAAASVFDQPAPLAPHAHIALEQLRPCFHLALLTKGDHEVQSKRVAESGLGDFFEEIVIVEKKDAFAFGRLAESFDVLPERAWSVGNSLRSDILPALEAGLHGVLVDAHVWEFERFERHHVPEGIPVLDDLGMLSTVLTMTATT
jgi:putative hydrolase of the HAD superfamily